MELRITRLSLRSYCSTPSLLGGLLSLLLALVSRVVLGGGIEPVSSLEPKTCLLSFTAHPSAAIIRLFKRRWTGVLVLLGVCSALDGGGELLVISFIASGVAGT